MRYFGGKKAAGNADAGDAFISADLAAHIGQAFLAGVGVAGTRWLDVLDPGFDAFYLHGIHLTGQWVDRTAAPFGSFRIATCCADAGFDCIVIVFI
jgi:hypothetical protein